MMLSTRRHDLEQAVRLSILQNFKNDLSDISIEGQLSIRNTARCEGVSLFFKDPSQSIMTSIPDPPRPLSNTSTLSFSTPCKLSASSGDTSPASSNGSSGGAQHRRKAPNPTRLDPMFNDYDAPLNLSTRDLPPVPTTPAVQPLQFSLPMYNPSNPNRELFPNDLMFDASHASLMNMAAMEYVRQQQQYLHAMTSPTYSEPMVHNTSYMGIPACKPEAMNLIQADSLLTKKTSPVDSKPKIPRKRRLPNSSSTTPNSTPGKSRRFSCNQCQNLFPSLATLSDHTQTVHGTYRCSVCPTEFTQRSNLQRHALKHVGFKPFECKVCGKAYYRKDHLARHVEQLHPTVTPRDGIKVNLSASESLTYLEQLTRDGLLPTTDSGACSPVGKCDTLEDAVLMEIEEPVADQELPVELEPGTVVVQPEHPTDVTAVCDADIDVVH